MGTDNKVLKVPRQSVFLQNQIARALNCETVESWKILSNYVLDTGLLSRIYEKCLQLTNKKTNKTQPKNELRI